MAAHLDYDWSGNVSHNSGNAPNAAIEFLTRKTLLTVTCHFLSERLNLIWHYPSALIEAPVLLTPLILAFPKDTVASQVGLGSDPK